MNYIKKEELFVKDEFAIILSNKLSSYYDEKESKPDISKLKKMINSTKTNFFQINRKITKSRFSEEIFNELPNVEIGIDREEHEKTIKILFLASNPRDTCHLRLDHEMRSIDKAVRSSDLRDIIKIDQQWAVKISEIQDHFLRYKPQIVHFSGHGTNESRIILENETGFSHPVSPDALSNLFKIFQNQIEVVVLNSCFSLHQAESIVKHISYVVGMSDSILDKTAITFSSAFYRGIGYGKSIEVAFELAKNQLDLENISGSELPVLLKK